MIFNLLDAEWPAHAEPAPTELVLYSAGNECSSVTGGWAAFAPAWDGNASAFLTASGGSAVNGTNPINGTGVKEDSSLKIYFRNPDRSQQWVNTAFGTKNRISLTNWNTLHVRATVSEIDTTDPQFDTPPRVVSMYRVFGVTQSKSTPTDGADTPPGNYKTLSVGDNSFDISALSGNQYVYVGGSLRTMALTFDAGRYLRIVVTKVWLT